MLGRVARRYTHTSPRRKELLLNSTVRYSRASQLRWLSSATSQLSDGSLRRKSQVASSPARQDSRPLATAATGYLQPSPDPIPFFYGPSSNHQPPKPYQSSAELPRWEITNLVVLPDTSIEPWPITKYNIFGVGGNPVELFQNLHACLRAGRKERAVNIVKRISDVFQPTATEVVDAHNVYIRYLVEELEAAEDHDPKSIRVLQKWFENDLRVATAPNADTYALMCRAALATQVGLQRDRTIRRYLSMASTAGLYEDTLDSDELHQEEADALDRIYTGYSANGLRIGSPLSGDSTLQSTISGHVFGSGRSIEVKPVEQKGTGLSTLRSSLVHVNKPETVPFPHDSDLPAKEKERSWAIKRQEMIEQSVVDEALASWRQSKESLDKMGISTVMKSTRMNALLWRWHERLQSLIAKDIEVSKHTPDMPPARTGYKSSDVRLGPYMEQLTPQQLSAVTIINVCQIFATNKEAHLGIKVVSLITMLGAALEAEAKFMWEGSAGPRSRPTSRGRPTRSPNRRVRRRAPDPVSASPTPAISSAEMAGNLLKLDTKSPAWPLDIRTAVAALLLSKLIEAAKLHVGEPGKEDVPSALEPAFYHTMLYSKGRSVGVLKAHEKFQEHLKKEPVNSILGGQLPMVVKPLPWTGFKEGGYIKHAVEVVKYKHASEVQRLYMSAAIEKGHMDQVFEGLTILGDVPWRINPNVYRVMLEAWNSGEAIANLAPENPNLTMPPEPSDPTDRRARTLWLKKKLEIQNEIGGFHSQRCFQNFQMEIARAYHDEIFYCPHNLDFRGRVYPVPPHLNHMGADNARALFIFADGKEVGETGLKWLKIHLANVYGFDKASLQERESFAQAHMDDIRDSATKPLNGRKWWLKAEDPWQCLAVCFELKNAMDLPDPTKFVSHIPVHQDGTCNGLQHYAALGGDSVGAEQVNLAPGERPADIYSAVAELVKVATAKDAEEKNPMALKLLGRITRKVVKQPVMTNVYGVTFVGAKAQVARQLAAIIPVSEQETDASTSIDRLAMYVTQKIFEALGQLFTGAQAIQQWLAACASRISTAISAEQMEQIVKGRRDKDEYGPKISTKKVSFIGGRAKRTIKLTEEFRSCVIWTTPLKMPVIQPYREWRSGRQLKTPMQLVLLQQPKIHDPVCKRKQLSAFPPNFIHSLDATHMLLSAIKCNELGLTFASVHDSFWTHAGDVPVMNRVLRDAFVRMHCEDIVGRLAAEFQARYKNSLYLAALPTHEEAAKAIKAWRKSRGYSACWGPNSKASMTELLEEHNRQKLLRSTSAKERELGQKMVTAASVYESVIGESLENIVLPGVSGRRPRASQDVEATEEMSDDDETEERSDHDESEAAVAEGEKPPRKSGKIISKIPLWLPLRFPPVPARGDFDVARLKDSQYFFS